MQALERRFMSHRSTWFAAVEAVAQLDALMALAGAGLAAEGPLCRPVVVDPQPGAGRWLVGAGNVVEQ